MVPERSRRLRRRVEETVDTWTLELEPSRTGPRPPDSIRGSSTCCTPSAPGRSRSRSAEIRPGGGLSCTRFARSGRRPRRSAASSPGRIGVRGPFGSSWPLEEAGEGRGDRRRRHRPAPRCGPAGELLAGVSATGRRAALRRTGAAELLYAEELERLGEAGPAVEVTVDNATRRAGRAAWGGDDADRPRRLRPGATRSRSSAGRR